MDERESEGKVEEEEEPDQNNHRQPVYLEEESDHEATVNHNQNRHVTHRQRPIPVQHRVVLQLLRSLIHKELAAHHAEHQFPNRHDNELGQDPQVIYRKRRLSVVNRHGIDRRVLIRCEDDIVKASLPEDESALEDRLVDDKVEVRSIVWFTEGKFELNDK